MGCYFSLFSELFAVKNRPRVRSDRGRLCHRKLRELYEADFYKLWIYGSRRVWATAWDEFRRKSSRGGRARRAAVDFVVCFGCDGMSLLFSRFFFVFERTRPAASMRLPCLIYLFISNEARPRERSDRGRSMPRQKAFIPGCVQDAII